MGPHPTLWLAFGAGLLSFISPCCVPLYPSYISYISGVAFASKAEQSLGNRFKALSHTAFFVLGFSIIFFALGLSATVIGRIFIQYRELIRVIGGLVIILMGLLLSEVIKPKWLMAEKRWDYRKSRSGYLTSVLVGVSFAAGWTPCVGPILASVLVLSAAQSAMGIALILMYIAGFASPFFVLAFTVASVSKLARYGAILSKVSGYVLIIMGVLLATNLLSRITVWLIRLYGGFTGF